MNFIYRSQLPKSEAEVRADLAAWIAEVEAHKGTVGVPAPFPEYELLRHLTADFVVLEDHEYMSPEMPEPSEETTTQKIARLKREIRSIEETDLMNRRAREAFIVQAEETAAEQFGLTPEQLYDTNPGYRGAVDVERQIEELREEIRSLKDQEELS